MSGFQDPEKLAAARELAQAFSKVKDPKKNSSGGGGAGGGGRQHRYEQRESYQPQHQGHYPQFVPQQHWQNVYPPISSVPPPSQRMYASTASFSTGRAGKSSVIGNAGLDFLNQAGIRPQASEAQPTQVPMTSQAPYAGFQPDISSNGAVGFAQFNSSFPQPAGQNAPGNILETFLAIAAKKPTIGQEIETLTEILPKAMDLNAPGTTASKTQADKQNSYANGSQGQNGKVEVHGSGDGMINGGNNSSRTNATQTRGSHSRKLSPVAAVFVPANNGSSQQAAGVNGESKVSVAQQAKGLSGSMWA